MKLTPEDLARIEDKKVANILRKIYTEKRTPTAREDAILQRAGIQASGNEPLTAFVGTWDDLATALGVTRRAIQDWRNDPRYAPELEQRKALLARADGRHCVAEWLRFMVEHNLKRGAASDQIEQHPGDGEDGEPAAGVIKPPPVGGSQAQWKVAIAALEHRRRATDIETLEGTLLVAAELEVPLGATFAAVQNKLAQFPERVAPAVAGFTDVPEIIAILRDEIDADLTDLHGAHYLDDVAALAATLPFDDESTRLLSLVTFDGQDKAALLQLVTHLTRETLRRIGRRAISATQNPPSPSSAGATPESVDRPVAPVVPDAPTRVPARRADERKPAGKGKIPAGTKKAKRRRKPRTQPTAPDALAKSSMAAAKAHRRRP